MPYYLQHDLIDARAQVLLPLTSVSTATTVFTKNAHGLVAGDLVALASISGLTGVTAGTLYYVVAPVATNTFSVSATRNGSAISVGTGSCTVNAIKEFIVNWPQSADSSSETSDKTWSGGGAERKLSTLKSLTYTLTSDAFDADALVGIFGKTFTTANVVGGFTASLPIGESAETGGKSCGMVFRYNGIKIDNGIETNVVLRRWAPSATITITNPGGLKSGETAGQMEFSLALNKTTTLINGAAIVGAPSGGAFVYLVEE